jgi:hypothetical protein
MYVIWAMSSGSVQRLGRQPRLTSTATDTYPKAGFLNLSTGIPRVAFVMKACQISAGHLPPRTWGIRTFG